MNSIVEVVTAAQRGDREAYGRSLREIAQKLNLPLTTVKKRLYTARTHLKRSLNSMSQEMQKPSQDQKMADRIQFYLALKANDLLQARQLVRRSPALLALAKGASPPKAACCSGAIWASTRWSSCFMVMSPITPTGCRLYVRQAACRYGAVARHRRRALLHK